MRGPGGLQNRGLTNRGVVLIPSYKSGCVLSETVRSALAVWPNVWVILDGCPENDANSLSSFSHLYGFRVLVRRENQGKGAAVLDGLRQAERDGYTMALVMDGDGQHPAQNIRQFFNLAALQPNRLILGVPIFGQDAPWVRIYGRKVGNSMAELETLFGGIRDSLFGFRVYPVRQTLKILESVTTARGFDFDTEIAVRLFWEGVVPVNVPVPVRYPPKTDGGISHFRYFRDNLLLARRHLSLFAEMIRRLPGLMRLRWCRR